MAEEENAMKILSVKEQNNKKGNKCWVYILAFLFPVMIFGAGFALKGVYPFGESSALVVDGVHQYTAFYKELLNQLQKGLGWTYSTHSMAIISMACFVIIFAVHSAFWYFCL